MKINQDGMLPIMNKHYAVTYKNEYDQVEVLEGVLVHPDLNGFTILNVNNKRVIIPKDRVFILRESEAQEDKPPSNNAAETTNKLEGQTAEAGVKQGK